MLFFRFLGSKTPIRLELDFDVAVDVQFFFGGKFKTKMPFRKDCGMEVTGLTGLVFRPGRAKIGPMACADTFEDLKIPKITDTEKGAMKFAAIKIAPEEIEMGQTAKTIGIGSMMLFGWGLSLIFLCCTVRCCCRMRQTGDQTTKARSPHIAAPTNKV